jgi:very-short-patch-repair endonuclease
LVIELDGSQHNEPGQLKADSKRDHYLASQGFTVFRIWNNEIDTNLDGIAERLIRILEKFK